MRLEKIAGLRYCSTATLWAIFVLALLVPAGRMGWSQESRGSITGKVADPQGAVIRGATVVVTNVETNAIRRASSNESGYFEVTLLNPGHYTVAVEAAGFSRAVRSGLDVNVASADVRCAGRFGERVFHGQHCRLQSAFGVRAESSVDLGNLRYRHICQGN